MPAIIVLVVAFLIGIVTHLPASQSVDKPNVKGESTVAISPTSTIAPTLIPTVTPTARPTLKPSPTIYVYPTKSVPYGATAICRDGTYSYSQHRSDTCSHHGGVAQWL